MSEKVKMTEEQYLNLMRQTCVFNLSSSGLNDSLAKAKQAGYILPDPVEEAEEIIKAIDYFFADKDEPYETSIDELIKIKTAIQIMKPYYEKYKGEKL